MNRDQVRAGNLEPKNLIPKTFHHIWFGPKPLPEEFRVYIETWKKLHQNWEFKFWNKSNLFPLVNQSQFELAQSPAQSADIARYEILHRYGGVYLDTDFECFKNIEPLLDGVDCFAAREDEKWVGIGIMGATPNHCVFDAVIKLLPSWFERTGPPNETTGPQLFTNVVKDRKDIHIFDPEFFYPRHYSGRAWGEMRNAYAYHHWAHSWR